MDKRKSLLLVAAVAAGSIIYNIWKPVKSKLPVKEDLDVFKFLGKWHQIARIKHFWDKNLQVTSLEFENNPDGTLNVTITGTKKGKPFTKVQQLKFAGEARHGALEFKGKLLATGFNIMHVDANYNYALVFGNDLDNLWILSRDGSITDVIREKYLQYAADAGYEMDQIIWSIQPA